MLPAPSGRSRYRQKNIPHLSVRRLKRNSRLCIPPNFSFVYVEFVVFPVTIFVRCVSVWDLGVNVLGSIPTSGIILQIVERVLALRVISVRSSRNHGPIRHFPGAAAQNLIAAKDGPRLVDFHSAALSSGVCV